jgi:hypothetical protein
MICPAQYRPCCLPKVAFGTSANSKRPSAGLNFQLSPTGQSTHPGPPRVTSRVPVALFVAYPAVAKPSVIEW